MIISRTPFRVSFFGGGTDYPAWYKKNGGRVLTSSIDKYCYISARYLPPFFPKKSRIVWSQIESINKPSECNHPVVRATLEYLKVNKGVEIHHTGDLPARAGLGSSSAFTVGLLHSLHALQGKMMSKQSLADEAVHIEQRVLRESVGVQDQIQVAHGGINVVDIRQDGTYQVAPVIIPRSRVEELRSHLMLFFTGFSRFASDIAVGQIKNIPKKTSEMSHMSSMVESGLSCLTGKGSLLDFGKLLHESWQIKRGLSSGITNSDIDQIYAKARKSGAVGGKLLGAGGGGFMLIFAKPEDHASVRAGLSKLLEIPFRFEFKGTHIVFFDVLDEAPMNK